jgi:hypothetical protein
MAARKIPTVPQRALANALERHREAAGLSREDVNTALEWSSMKSYRIETARVTVSPGDILQLAKLYHLSDADTGALVELARQAKRPGWWKGMAQSLPAGFSVHLELESTARAIRTYEAQFSPACGRPRTTPEQCCPPAAPPAPPSRSNGRSPSGCAASRSWTAPARRHQRYGRSWTSRSSAVS